LEKQTSKDYELIIIDSSSNDTTVAIAKEYGAVTIIIPKKDFDHGRTRNLGASEAKGDIVLYLTQDALPADEHSLKNLIKPFHDDNLVAASYGRQLPNPDASPISRHLRLFNYPDTSYIRSINDRTINGIKTVFLSNSFSAYRREILEKIGAFKEKLIFGEDMHAAGRLLLAGYKVAYNADAMVYHSHNYTVYQEFERYFDLGVLHGSEDWILKEFGTTGGEGKKYIDSGISYLLKDKRFHLIPAFLFRNLLKYIGYNLGLRYDKIPLNLSYRFSMNKAWWGTSANN
jgi:rhamnosyltransferase